VNLPATLPLHASQMYAKNLQNFLQLVVKDGAFAPDFQDEIVQATCVTRDGKVLRA
jgi:NAD(P) transhydrogenase subunit alpha